MASLRATLYSDPGCPWAYSANPALTVLRWRYADGIDWRLVTIGLSESAERYEQLGYTPARMAKGHRSFRRFGMPFALQAKPRVAATGRACRAIVATRMRQPGLEFGALRALQFGWFTSTLVLDEDDAIAEALATVPGLDVRGVMAALGDPDVEAEYERDRREARTAAGGATEFQGKARETDGEVRFTAPSVVFEGADGARAEAGGFQPVEAYDVVIANFAGRPARREPPAGPLELIRELPWAVTTQEVAAALAEGNDAPDRAAAEEALIDLAAGGEVSRTGLGDDALWGLPAPVAGVRAA